MQTQTHNNQEAKNNASADLKPKDQSTLDNGVSPLHPLQEMANNSPQVKKIAAYQQMADNSPQVAQLKSTATFVQNTPNPPIKVAQLKIKFSGGKYSGDGERHGWRKPAEDKMAADLSTRTGTNLTADNINYKNLKMDRAHVVAFEKIETWVVDYLNSKTDFATLKTNTESLVAECDKAYIEATLKALNDLKSGFEAKSGSASIVGLANTLESYLNSAPENLRGDNKYLNRYTGQELDGVFESAGTPGMVRADAHTKRMIRLGPAAVGKVLLTPKRKQEVVTSGGAVPFGSMTPETKHLFQNHASTTRNALSKNVKSGLAAPNRYMSTGGTASAAAGGGSARTTPKPKLDLGGASDAKAAVPTGAGTSSSAAASSAAAAVSAEAAAKAATNRIAELNSYQQKSIQSLAQLSAQYQQISTQANQLVQSNTNIRTYTGWLNHLSQIQNQQQVLQTEKTSITNTVTQLSAQYLTVLQRFSQLKNDPAIIQYQANESFRQHLLPQFAQLLPTIPKPQNYDAYILVSQSMNNITNQITQLNNALHTVEQGIQAANLDYINAIAALNAWSENNDVKGYQQLLTSLQQITHKQSQIQQNINAAKVEIDRLKRS